MKNPAHPAAFVKTEVPDRLGLSVTQAAIVLGITRPALSAFLNQRTALSADTAIRIEKAFGASMAPEGRQARRKQFFFEKRTKKLLPVARGREFNRDARMLSSSTKVFWFFFSKKNCFLAGL